MRESMEVLILVYLNFIYKSIPTGVLGPSRYVVWALLTSPLLKLRYFSIFLFYSNI